MTTPTSKKKRTSCPLEYSHYALRGFGLFTTNIVQRFTFKNTKDTDIHIQAYRLLRSPRFLNSCHMMVARLCHMHLPPLSFPGDIPGTYFCQRPIRLQGHSVARRIKSIKNLNDTIEYRTRDLSVCREVPEPTAQSRPLDGAFILAKFISPPENRKKCFY